MKSLFLLLATCLFLASGIAWADNDNAVGNAAQSTKQYVSDATITAQVKSQLLMDPDIKSLPISVVTEQGVVVLSGTVDTQLEKEKAARIALEVSGVKSVVNKIKVKQANRS